VALAIAPVLSETADLRGGGGGQGLVVTAARSGGEARHKPNVDVAQARRLKRQNLALNPQSDTGNDNGKENLDWTGASNDAGAKVDQSRQLPMRLNTTRNACKDRSQFGQGAFVESLFGDNGRFPASSIAKTFVEFGCRDGVAHSNTILFECLGWKGQWRLTFACRSPLQIAPLKFVLVGIEYRP
jgi:hypothetical protein